MIVQLLRYLPTPSAAALAAVAACSVTTLPATELTAAAAVQQALSPPPQSIGAGDTFQPTIGQAGKDVVWVPTSPELVELMLDLAKITPRDYVIDLGSGDGRNIIAAAKRGAPGHGVEFNPDMVALSNRLAREAGVADRARFIEGDMYKADLSKATVLALFLLPTNLDQLKDRFLALPAGTRIVVNTFTLDGWEPDTTSRLETGCTSWCNALLLVVPARVAGRWRMENGSELTLTQEYRNINGTLAASGSGEPTMVRGKVSASDVAFEVNGSGYVGRIDGNRIIGTMTSGATSRGWSATKIPN